MSSDKKFHLCQLWRMSLEVYQGTGRRTTGKSCMLVLALGQERPEQGTPLKMVVRRGETRVPVSGGAGGVVNSRNNSRNGSGMVWLVGVECLRQWVQRIDPEDVPETGEP